MSLNILVVDDSGVIRKMIIKTLRLAGVPVSEAHEAGDGQGGLDALDAHWIDMVFADLNMPGMNGEEMIARIRASSEWGDMPIVIISTEGSETRIQKLLDANTRFIHKPFTPETVRNVVTEMLGVGHEPS